MEGLIILGAAGGAKEFHYYAKRANPNLKNFIFVNDLDDGQHELCIDGVNYPVIKNWIFEEKYNFIVAIGNAKVKKAMVEKAINAGLKPSPTIIDPGATVMMPTNNIGYGGIIATGCIITSDVTIGNYVTLNLNTTIGHDTLIGDYCTTNPGVHISGECKIGEMNEFGTGCIVKDRLTIGSNKKFGAQAAVVKSIYDDSESTYIGIPAKNMIKQQ